MRIRKNNKFSTLSDIDDCVAEISDNLAGGKQCITLNIRVLWKIVAARSHEKMYNLAGIWSVNIYRNILSVNTLHHIGIPKPSARLSDI